MDVICFNNKLLNLINSISINVGIVEFMDYFPLLKQGKANIKTIHYIIKCHVLLGGNISIDLKHVHDITDDNICYDDYLKFSVNKIIDLSIGYEEERVLAYQLLDIICICKSEDYHPKTGQGWKRIKLIATLIREKSPELSLFILCICIVAGSNLTNKVLNNNHVKLARDIYYNHRDKINNAFFIKESMLSDIRELVVIKIGDLDPRHGNNTLYKFAKLLNETETCNMIKQITIKRNWLEKQVLIRNFEDIIGPSDIPNNIFDYMTNFM